MMQPLKRFDTDHRWLFDYLIGEAEAAGVEVLDCDSTAFALATESVFVAERSDDPDRRQRWRVAAMAMLTSIGLTPASQVRILRSVGDAADLRKLQVSDQTWHIVAGATDTETKQGD